MEWRLLTLDSRRENDRSDPAIDMKTLFDSKSSIVRATSIVKKIVLQAGNG